MSEGEQMTVYVVASMTPAGQGVGGVYFSLDDAKEAADPTANWVEMPMPDGENVWLSEMSNMSGFRILEKVVKGSE